jgi:hypothetical protein
MALLSDIEGVRYRVFQISVTMFLGSFKLNHVCRLDVVYLTVNAGITACIQ